MNTTVIIPTFNEEGNIHDLLQTIVKTYPKIKIIVADDGSKDKTIEVSKKAGADKIFSQMEHFGGYGFNKSHATAYGLLAYQTAYLKANYKHEYMASLITSAIGHSAIGKEEGNKMVEYKCFFCNRAISDTLLRKKVRCPYCGSKILFKPRTASTKVKAR